ncbi:MAG: nucleotidyl transferase AbiEii/AbiGii toxin family protein [Arcobacteraceae bacterium]
MNKVANLAKEQRSELFTQSALKMSTTKAIIEKDFWVVWVLDKIFADSRLNKILMFKGGTSLSKVFNLIGRFSEDIDLILDWTEITKIDLTKTAASKSQQVKLNETINNDAKVYIKEQLLPILKEILSSQCVCVIDETNEYNIEVTYPSTFKDRYLRPQILLEIGPLASWLPSDSFTISSYASSCFPKVFEQVFVKVNAIIAKRTFWEKATILHQETNREENKLLPPRYSRHYYDLALMARSEVKDEALNDFTLLAQVVDFKNKFYPSTWAKFDDAKKGTIKLVPSIYRFATLKNDYKEMQDMIFDKKLSFEEIIDTLQELEDEINS